MSSVSETVDKVDQSLESMGIDGIQENLENILDF